MNQISGITLDRMSTWKLGIHTKKYVRILDIYKYIIFMELNIKIINFIK